MAPTRSPRRPLSDAIRLFRKELREALRDRSLVLQLVVIPLFLYPVLGFAAWQVFLVSQGAAEKRATVVMLDPEVPSPVREQLSHEGGLRLVTTPASLDQPGAPPTIEAFRRLRDGHGAESPSVLVSWWSPSVDGDSALVFYDNARERSRRARRSVIDALVDHRDSLVSVRAGSVGLQERDLDPWRLETEDVATSRDVGRYMLSLVLPIFLMIMLPQGTYYAALDAVVGERERGTWETILSTPMRRGDILLGKYLHVVFWGMTTFSLNLLSLTFFLGFVLHLIGMDERLQLDVDPAGLAVAAAAALLLALTLAAVMMVVAMPARNYREGQASLSPVYMVSAFAGMFVITAGDDFTWVQALIPVVNVTALLKASFRGEIPLGPALVTFGTLAVFAAACLAFAARLARSEQIFFDPELSLRKLLRMGGNRE